jgi:hypothetical protein
MGCHLPDQRDLPTPQMFVEFAHIYADEVFGMEQHQSLEVMKSYLDRECDTNSLVVSAILIDDLHIQDNTLDVTEFIRCILRRGLAPDHVIFEGKLGPVAQQIIDLLPPASLSWQNFKGGKRVLSYRGPEGRLIGLLSVTEDHSEYTCALLSAAWSLCRAGIYEFPQDSIVRLTEAPVSGHRVVSVLHRKYEGVEAKVIELIRGSGHADLVDRLELVFFD